MNDNSKDDPLPFIQLAAVVANVTRYLLRDEQQVSDQGSRAPDRHDAKDEKTEEAPSSAFLVLGRKRLGARLKAASPSSLLTEEGARRRTVSDVNYVVVSW